jgi:hypothetical protein
MPAGGEGGRGKLTFVAKVDRRLARSPSRLRAYRRLAGM